MINMTMLNLILIIILIVLSVKNKKLKNKIEELLYEDRNIKKSNRKKSKK